MTLPNFNPIRVLTALVFASFLVLASYGQPTYIGMIAHTQN